MVSMAAFQEVHSVTRGCQGKNSALKMIAFDAPAQACTSVKTRNVLCELKKILSSETSDSSLCSVVGRGGRGGRDWERDDCNDSHDTRKLRRELTNQTCP